MYTDSQIDSKVTKIILYTKKNKTPFVLLYKLEEGSVL